jgi:hypothetical protein
MTRACLSLLPFTLLFSLGCNAIVTVGGGGPDGSDGEASGGESATSPPPISEPPPAPAAIQADNIAAAKGDVLEIALGNYVETCGPSAFGHYPENYPPCLSDPSWRLRLNIPVAALQVGAVLPFPDVSQGWTYSEIDPMVPYEPQYGCGGGGGSYWEGTVEVLAITGTSLKLRLAGTSPFYSSAGGNADGDYDVALCGPTAPPAHVITSAVATTSAQTLVLVATNLPNTCANPHLYGAGCATEVDSVTIVLPPEMQAVGTYPLTNIATFSTRGQDAYGDCSIAGAGSYWNGTIQIVSIDASQVAFTLSGTDQHFISPGTADGSYLAPRCN